MMTETPDQPPFDWQAAAQRLLGDDVTFLDAERHTVATAEGQSARIRTWAPPATAERITAIRALLERVPPETPIPRPIGAPGDVAMIAGSLTDACTVIDGLPLSRHGRFDVPGHGEIAIPLHETNDPGEMLVETARALGHVHAATRDQSELGGAGHLSALELHVAAKARWQDARKRLGSHAEHLVEVRRWLRCGNRVIPIAGDRLHAAGEVATSSPVLIHNDIWPADLLVDAPSLPTQLRGVTGWTSARAGSPVIDLAQLSARVTGWSEASVESVLGAYSEIAPLQPTERRLVPVIAAVDLLDQLAVLLDVAYLDDAVANDPAQPFIRGGIKVLLRSLERLTNVLAPPEPHTRRTWVRSPGRQSSTPPPARPGSRRSRREKRARRGEG